MAHQFKKHYTREEARALLPRVREWLKELVTRRRRFEEIERRLESLRHPGDDLGGKPVNEWVQAMVTIRELLMEFYRREIQIKDLDRGLIDFPALRDGKEVFLCWEDGESDIEFWHDLDTGYAGRERLD
jgi:hypothetical protein